MYIGHLDLSQPLLWTVDDALPVERCEEYISYVERGSPMPAPIAGHGGEVLDPTIRNNTRIMWDDAEEADGLLLLVRERVPDRMLGMSLRGANPRLRLYRYDVGQRHGPHWDSVVELPGGLRSLVTLVFYLNDDFEGGETDFPELQQRVQPMTGRALLFQHRILHEAMEVAAGVKYVLRTDILYGPG